MSTHTTNAIVQTAKLVTLGDAIRAKAGLSAEMTLDEMATAVANIQTGGTYQSKTVSPTTSQQTVSPDAGYDALSSVTVNAMPTGTAGTPSATKGAVSNHAVSVTPSVTNTAGYIAGGTKTGTAVSVSASELVSGTLSITSSGTKDVTNYASASVASGSASTPATTITANPVISVSASGLITANVVGAEQIAPMVSAGYVSTGTAGTISVSGSNTKQLSTQSAQTITPTTTDQTIASGKYLTGTQTIKGDANLLAENIKKDVVIFGITGTYEGEGSSTYSVTISLTNPRNPGEFSSCNIYEALSGNTWDGGNYLDGIVKPTGAKTVQLSSSVYGVLCEINGMSVYIPTSGITTTGGVRFVTRDGGMVVFEVTGDGTATLDSIDYDD